MTPLLVLAITAVLATQGAEDALQEAQALIEQGHGFEALVLLERAARDDRENAELHYELGRLYGTSGRIAEALSALRRSLELDADNTTYLLALGETLFRSGRSAEALPLLERVVLDENAPDDAWLFLAGALEQEKQTERFLEALERYVELVPNETPVRVLLGEKLLQARRREEALEVMRAGLRDGVEPDANLLTKLAEELARTSDTYEEAETLARRAIDAASEFNLEAHLALARVLERTERGPEALTLLESARDGHPRAAESAELHYALTGLYRNAGRADDARQAAETFQTLSKAQQAEEERRARVAAVYKQGAEQLGRGDMLSAERTFVSVLEIDPENPLVRSMLAKIAFSKGDTSGARKWIDEALERDDRVGEYHYLSALFYVRSGNVAQGERSARRAVELDPNFPDAWALLGSMLLDTNRAEDAVESFQRAAALEPRSPTHQLNLASAYAALGKEAEERTAMERYRSLSKSP